MEIISAILFQLTRNLTPEEIKANGFDTYFVDHTTGIYPASASGVPFTAAYFQSKGDPITDLVEDMAADGAACLGRLLTAVCNNSYADKQNLRKDAIHII